MEKQNKITRRRFLGKVVGGTTAAIVLPNLADAAEKSKLPVYRYIRFLNFLLLEMLY